MKLAACLLLVLAVTSVPSLAQRPLPSHAPTAPPAGASDGEVARVNGVPVTSSRLAAALSALIPQESFHRNVSPEKLATLRERALSTVIDDELAYQDGVRSGITASDADVKVAWDRTVARYGGTSKMDDALQRAGVTRASVQKEIARQLIVEKSYERSVSARCGVGKDEARQFFKEHPERFLEPEQVHVHAITVGVDPSSTAQAWTDAKARAGEARAALAAGKPFADVARAYSTDPSRDKGGDLGFIHRGSMASPFEDIVRQLDVDVPSDVIESIYGYHVVLVSGVRPPQQKTFDQVSASLISDLSKARCAERKAAWLKELRASARIQTAGAAQ